MVRNQAFVPPYPQVEKLVKTGSEDPVVSEFSSPLAPDLQLNLHPSHRVTHRKPVRTPWKVASRMRWPIYLLAIAVCLYRISIFRPIPLDDGAGALRPILYGWFQRYVALSGSLNDAFSTWSQWCLGGLVGITMLAVLNYLWRENLIRLPTRAGRLLCSPGLFWSLLAFTLLLCRIPTLLRGELNPDESQFLASAEKLFYDPNYFRSVDCGTTGPLTVYALMLPAIFGISPDLASSRLIGVIAVLLSIFFLYRALKLFGNEWLARLSILPIAGTFAMFRNGDLVHFSSEQIPFVLVSLSIYEGAKVMADAHKQLTPSFFRMGLLASAAYFTKMQALPIIVSVGAVSLAYVRIAGYGLRIWRSVWSGFAGVLVPIVCIVALCLSGGVFKDFWRTYVRANMLYANIVNPDASLRNFAEYVTNFVEVRFYLFTVFAIVVAYLIRRRREPANGAQTPFAELLVLSVAISASAFLSSAERSSVYAYIAVLCICAAPVYFLLLFQQHSSRQDPVRWFGFLAVLSTSVAVYCVYKPHRYFYHYLLFLFVPLGAVVGYLLIRENQAEECPIPSEVSSRFRRSRFLDGRCAFWGAVLVLTLSCEIYLWNFQDLKDFDLPPRLASVEGNLIRYLTSPESKIFVWGWDLNPYFSSGRVPATRDTTVITSFQSYRGMNPPVYVPTAASERLSSIYRKRMLRDLHADPPALFIDAVGPSSWFLREREYWGFELVPSVKEFIDHNYVHLIDLYGQRYFMRRDLAAKRDAEFSRPLPTFTCSPTAILCSDRLTTLPTELPVTNIPGHTRIDIEFMPIHEQLGPATVFNSEKIPAKFRGIRLQYIEKHRYLVLIGVGDSWVISKAFSAPENEAAFVSIQLNGTTATLEHNGVLVDEMHLPHPFADAGGPVTLGSWIGGVDPFSGAVRFMQILDLNKKQNKAMEKAR